MTNKIEISRELAVERLTEIANRDSAVSVTVRAEDLRAILAAPAVERQEPVAWRTGACVWTSKGVAQNHADDHGLTVEPLYTSPPAPVAVVLPDDWQDQLFAEMERRFDLRKQIDDDHMVYDDTQIGVEFARDWIAACLDKVKEMNQSAAPGFTTVDVATADADGFRSGRKSLGLLLAPAFRTIEQKGGKCSVKLAFEDSADAWAAYEEIEKASALAVKS